MSQISVRIGKRGLLVRKLSFWIAISGFIFVMGSIVAQEADSIEGVEEKEEITADKSNDEAKATTDSPETDDQSASTTSNTEEIDSKKATAVEKNTKKKSDPKVAKEKVKKKNPETGSHLPNGDPTSNVIRLTGDAVRDFYWRAEYLRW